MKSVGFFLNAFSFLELEPSYICYEGSKSYNCRAKDFCGTSIRHEPNWEDSETLYNFIMQYGLECEDSFKIGLFGSFFLLGVVIGCLTLTRLGDVVGRKPIFMLGMCMQIAITFTIIFMTNEYVAYGLCLLEGISMTGKQYVGYSLLIENQPKSK
jgi:MFS family permease